MAKSKMKTCKHCGAEIAKSAKVCPNCGGKNKKPIFKRVWFWILIILILLVAIGGGARHKLSDDAGNMPKKEFKAACETYDYKDIMRDVESYKGKKIKISGRVNQVVTESEDGTGESEYKVATGEDGYDDDILLYFQRGDTPKLLEDDQVTIYGEISGTETYTSILGESITVPVITGAYVDIE